ncbi:Stf0 family sulfotransferase [Pseudoroseicyclus sp. H15]
MSPALFQKLANRLPAGPSLTLSRLGEYWLARPFAGVPDRPRFRELQEAKGLPGIRYALFFTPRSGSSRITDLAQQAGGPGDPGEMFNPNFTHAIAKRYGAQSREAFHRLSLLERQRDGVFGCEITYAHVLASFGGAERFFAAIQPTALLWLIREDIVAQALSVSRKLQTGHAHSPGISDEVIQADEAAFTYDARAIRGALLRIHNMEQRTEALLAAQPLAPLRLSYEQSIAMSEAELLGRIAAHVGAPPPGPVPFEPRHRKLSGSRSRDYAQRFREENARLLARIDAARQPMLAKLREAP